MRPPGSGPVAVLDDYQSVASECADWGVLGREVEFFHDHVSQAGALVERLEPFEVVVAMRERAPFPRVVLEALPRLRLLVTTGTRNAVIDLCAARELGITVCGTRSLGHPPAELAFGLVLALARDVPGELESVRAGGWQVGLGRALAGSVLGVVGLGRLGGQVARFGLAFGMEVIAWSENLSEERAREVGVRRVTRDQLLSTSDFVTIHLKLGERTRGLVGRRELELMKPTSYLVNTSRGPIVDADALLEAVRSGTIAGAALDVFDVEPLPADHPFRHEPRILATPHIGYVTRQGYEVFYGDAVEDIEAWTAGAPVRLLES